MLEEINRDLRLKLENTIAHLKDLESKINDVTKKKI